MSIWTDIGQFLSTIATDAFHTVVENIRVVFEGNAETRNRVAFSVAIIALSAKMAKADGVVTEEEVEAFQEIFSVPAEEIKNVARLYNLAKRDVAGYTSYAKQVRRLFPGDRVEDEEVLQDVIDALFHIAKADGVIHENELMFLEDISALFEFEQSTFEQIRLRHVHGEDGDPYVLLGADPSWSLEELKRHYRKRVAESHPDRLIARGVPPEFIIIANDRMASINAAWEQIEKAVRSNGEKAVVA